MTSADRQILFMALGFVAVILHSKPQKNQHVRAIGIAKLIEEFCRASLPELFEADNLAEDYSQGVDHDQSQEQKSRR